MKEKKNNIENKNQIFLKSDEKTEKIKNKKLNNEFELKENEVSKNEENKELIEN